MNKTMKALHYILLFWVVLGLSYTLVTNFDGFSLVFEALLLFYFVKRGEPNDE